MDLKTSIFKELSDIKRVKMFEIAGSFGKRFVKISGGDAKIREVEKAIGCIEGIDSSNETTSQIFNAKRIAGKNHLLHALKLALESLEKGNQFADDPRIELTCWTAALRQIDKAINRVGVKEDSDEIAVITIGEDSKGVKKSQRKIFRELDIKEDEGVLEITDEKIDDLQEAFSILRTQLKISSLEDIVIEKIALLGLEQ